MKQLILMTFLIAAIVPAGFADGGRATKAYSLTIKLTESHDPAFAVCTLVRTGEPFEIALTKSKNQTVLSGQLESAKNEVYPLRLEVSQGRGDRWDFDRLGYELKLGAVTEDPVVYTRNHPGTGEPQITLEDGGCPMLKDDDLK